MQVWQKIGDAWKAEAINAVADPSSFERGGLWLHSFFEDGMPKVALVTRDPRLRVNGIPVVGGLKILQDRDEILVGDQRFYFSSESPPEITIFQSAADGKPPRCAVCRMDIRDGDQVVKCPRCGLVCHQRDGSDGRPTKHCWTHRESCVRCGHPTAMTGEAAWRPNKEADCD